MNNVVAELVGGPHDGSQLRLPQLQDRLEDPIPRPRGSQHDTLLPERYDLDPCCLDVHGNLVKSPARYLFQPPANA